MPLLLEPAVGEVVFIHADYRPYEGAEPFAVVVTDRAVLLPRKALFAATDPWSFQRFGLQAIRSASISPTRPYALWLLSAFLVAAGLVALVPLIGSGGPYPAHVALVLALVLSAFLLPFTSRGRHTLVIISVDRTYRWTPPFLHWFAGVPFPAGRKHIQEATHIQRSVAGALQRAGVLVHVSPHMPPEA